jgi:hypothetical protein
MNDRLPVVGPLSAQLMDFFIIAGAIGLVILLTFIWALFFRKSGKRKRKERRRRRRPLNPTLADIGGLPPIREEEKKPDNLP